MLGTDLEIHSGKLKWHEACRIAGQLLFKGFIPSQCQLYPFLFVPGLLEMRGRPCEGLPEATPSLRGLGRGSWEQKATKAMRREGAG